MKAIDPYADKNFIERKFSGEMEVSVEDVKALLEQCLALREIVNDAKKD